jgi:hypothetical protein
MTPILYAKWGGIAAAFLAWSWLCFHQGSLEPTAALALDHAAMAKAATDALLAERAAAEAQAINDHATETTHANDIATIDHTPPRTNPVIVYRNAAAVCQRAVPGAKTEAGGLPADTQEGGTDSGRGINIRAALNDLEMKYEKVLADYRQLDAEWPTK